jgi:hypothetical protein
MTQLVQNPLSSYFRRPSLYIKLPTDGKFWPVGTLEMTSNQELPVMPMTAIDEITYRTPDALFNGQAVVDVLQSCLPNVKHAWAAPTPDVNAMLIAIRIASFGHNLDVFCTCPKCGTGADYSLDLRHMLSQVQCSAYDQPLVVGDLSIHFRPISYQEQNETGRINFETQQTIRSITESSLPEDQKVTQMKQCLESLNQLTMTAIVQAIASIQTPQVIVTEGPYIMDFLKNSSRQVFEQIKSHAIALKADSDLKPVDIKCSECDHQYQQPVVLDQTSFFGPAS